MVQRLSLAVVLLAGATLSSPALGQVRSKVDVPQISPRLGSRTGVAETTLTRPAAPAQSGGAKRGNKDAGGGDEASIQEICRNAALRAEAPPTGVECARAAEVQAEAGPTAEGSLLQLLGRPGTVTQPSSQRQGGSPSAAAVAQVGQDASVSDAAAIAARQRGGAPPPR